MQLSLALLLPLLMNACMGAGVTEKPLTAEEMPVVFAPQEVMDGEPKYERVYDDRTGADIRRMTTTVRRAAAVAVYQSLPGDYVFSGATLRASLERMVSPDAQVVWGDSGSLTRVAVATDWQAFELTVDGAHIGCMGVRRELRHHAEAGNMPNSAQALAVAYLCRQGPPMTGNDAVRVAAVLRERV